MPPASVTEKMAPRRKPGTVPPKKAEKPEVHATRKSVRHAEAEVPAGSNEQELPAANPASKKRKTGQAEEASNLAHAASQLNMSQSPPAPPSQPAVPPPQPPSSPQPSSAESEQGQGGGAGLAGREEDTHNDPHETMRSHDAFARGASRRAAPAADDAAEEVAPPVENDSATEHADEDRLPGVEAVADEGEEAAEE